MNRFDLVLKVPVIRAFTGGHTNPACIRIYSDTFGGNHLVLDVGCDHMEMTRHELMSLAAGITAHYKMEDSRNASKEQGPAPEAQQAPGGRDNHADGVPAGSGGNAEERARENPEEAPEIEAGPAAEIDLPN